jgi:HD-like signal output (HDOD) protein
LSAPKLDEAGARAIAEDVVLSARVVMVANSALFSRGGGCRRVDQAVARIGVELLRALVLGIEMTESMRALAREVDVVHGHSLEVGFLARRLCREDRADEALLTGIVHDIGQLVLMQCAPRTTRKALALEQPDAVMAMEVEFGGVTHAQLGAYLLGLWGMSYEIVHAVASHHDPIGVLPPELDVADALRVAAALLEGRTGEDPRWPTWVALAEQVRANAA